MESVISLVKRARLLSRNQIREIALSISETVAPLLGGTTNSQLTYVATSARELGKMLFPLPTNTYQAATQLPVTKIA